MRTCSRNTTQPWECKNKLESWGEGGFVLFWLSCELPTCLLSHTSWSAVLGKLELAQGGRSCGTKHPAGSSKGVFLVGALGKELERAVWTVFY